MIWRMGRTSRLRQEQAEADPDGDGREADRDGRPDGRARHALGAAAGGEHRVLVDLAQAERLVADALEGRQDGLVVEPPGAGRVGGPQLVERREVEQVVGVPRLDGPDDVALALDGDVVLRPAEPLEELRSRSPRNCWTASAS